MPTYHARGVTISLGVSSLADTITSNIGLRKGDIVRKQCEQAEQALLNSRFLSEKRVPPSGDEHDFELHWLGGAPFMQAEVGRDSFSGHDEEDSPHPSSTVHSLRVHRPLAKHGIYETTCDPLALSLHVVTSERTFISGLDNSNKLHIKIEVFLNGTLSNCLFFPPYEYRSGAKELHQVFAGHRVDFLAERPWVILPPNTAADGSRSKATSLSSVEQRWAEICKALSKEADQRGSNKYSEVPSTAEFLKALAAMNMPPQVRTMQSPGGRQLGIVDVMITAGHGRKVTSGAAYLKAPQRFNDDNFPLRNTAEPPAGLNTAIHADGKRDGARNTFVSMPEYQDLRAGQQTGAGLEPRSKRRAVESGEWLSSSNQPGLHDSRLQKPDRMMQAFHPHSPSKDVLEGIQASTTPTMRSRAGSLLVSLEAPSDPALFPKRGRADQSEFMIRGTDSLYSASSYNTLQSFPCFSGSNVSRAHTPRMQPSPYSYQFPVSPPGHHSPGAFLPTNASSFSDIVSSHPHHMQTVANSPRPQQFPNSYTFDADRLSNLMMPSSAFPPSVVLESPRRSSIGSPPKAMSSPPTPPVSRREELYSQLPPLDQCAGSAPNMLSSSEVTAHRIHTPSNGVTFASPLDRRFSMPLPPTGFFSVPTKPKPNISSCKQVQPQKYKASPRGLSIRRLVIKGRNGIIVVDYTWPITQHIPKHGQVVPSLTSRLSTTTIDPTLGPAAVKAGGKRGRLSQKPLPLVKDAHQNCEPDAQLCPITIKNGGASNVMEGGSFGTHDTHGAGMTEHRMEHEPAQVAHSEIIPPEKESNKRNISKPVVPQRRTISGSNILGVQGPKATTFWFDNPEQLIREAAKERRIESSRKPRNDASIGPNTIALQASGVLTEPAARSSSPLSSIHTSPVAESDNRQMTEYIPSNLTADIPLSQLDGSSEPLLPTTLPSKPISPSKPNRKKRKAPAAPAVGRYLEKQPRSPDRLKTISNPPLNQDCVIALAESEDKSAERGVLRQVRGERQGVFAEDYVVFATRFFIPGN